MTQDMRTVPGHSFEQGSEAFYSEERPTRLASVEPFRIDTTPVTNGMFARFVLATGYVTDAERVEDASIGSLLFAFHDNHGPASWRFVNGISWRRPYGLASTWEAIARHPVVHVSPHDASAYAEWVGKRLPSEREWEAAARGGLYGCDYAWGNTLAVNQVIPAHIWDGEYPETRAQGRALPFSADVASYEPNGFGLYDMIGNVWEWTADKADGILAAPGCCDRSDAVSSEARIIKGGSHLCAPNWCRRYRPAARQVAALPTSHIGFRCAAALV